MRMQIGLVAHLPATRRAIPSSGADARGERREVPLAAEVGRRLGMEAPTHAIQVVLAVLEPLLGTLSLADGAQLKASLPGPIRRGLRHDDPILGVAFQPPDNFLTELADRNEIDIATAAAWTRAVCAALAVELPAAVLGRIRAQAPALVREFFPGGERLAAPLPERAHRCQKSPPLWSEIQRPVPSYLMFASGDPITGRATEGVSVMDGHRPDPVFEEQAHVPTHGPVVFGGSSPRRVP